MTLTPARHSLEQRASLAIIGLGPRGASLIERLGAQLTAAPLPGPLDLLLIDDAQPGAGKIWRTDQTRELCMNTLADAVTLFTEPSSTVSGPVVEGPTLYEWALIARERDAGRIAEVPPARAAAAELHPARAGLAADFREELSRLRPESHPSRALYGEYLSWFFHRAVAILPKTVRVIHHQARALSVERHRGTERITLDSGWTVTADTIIAATGWLPRRATSADRTIEAAIDGRPELRWVREGSPIDQDLSTIRPGEQVIVRGLGMGFFDTMALLTLERGGYFEADPDAVGGLRYVASGQEPVLHVTSRRGVPFRAKSRYGGLPPRAAQTLLREVDWSLAPRPIDFDTQLWPRIVGDAFLAHATTLRAVRPEAFLDRPGTPPDTTLADLERAVRDAIAPVLSGQFRADLDTTVALVERAVAQFIPAQADRLDLAGEIRPARAQFASPAAYDRWVAARVSDDLAEADLGELSALKAGLWSLSSARSVANEIGTLGGFDADSRESGAALLTSLGGMVGSGPPAFRNSQLLALQEAGLVHFIGPDARVSVDQRGFVAASPAVADSEITAHALIDAWMHLHDVRDSVDPLTRDLIGSGRARAFAASAPTPTDPLNRHNTHQARASVPPGALETAGIDVDAATGRLVGAAGALDPAIHLAGIPAEETLLGTIISPMPGTDPPMLRETDRIAHSAIAIARHATGLPAPILEGALSA